MKQGNYSHWKGIICTDDTVISATPESCLCANTDDDDGTLSAPSSRGGGGAAVRRVPAQREPDLLPAVSAGLSFALRIPEVSRPGAAEGSVAA